MVKIIGAGPAGCYSAYLLAKQGFNVEVFEDHKEIGKPVQCTGIMTHALNSIIKIKKEFLVNKVKYAKLNTLSGNSLELKLKNPDYIVDRSKFDSYLASMARNEGVKFNLGERFLARSKNKIKVKRKIIKFSKLVGADGPSSAVAKASKMYGHRKFVAGTQARVKMKCCSDTFETWLGLGEFAWLVPESDSVARVGVISRSNPSKHLKNLLKRLPKHKILQFQGGLVPLYNPGLKIQKSNTFLLGDAATQVKATTYGGVVFGLIAAQELAKSFSKYETNCKKAFGNELYISLLLRKILNKFSTKEYNELIETFSSNELRPIIQNQDRNFPIKMLLKMFYKKPSLAKYVKKLI